MRNVSIIFCCIVKFLSQSSWLYLTNFIGENDAIQSNKTSMWLKSYKIKVGIYSVL